MDPLSISLGAISLISHFASILSALSRVSTGSYADMIQETQVCLKLLEETAEKASKIERQIPLSALACLELCATRGDLLLKSFSTDYTSKIKMKLKRVPESNRAVNAPYLDDFRNSVMMFRTVVMDTIMETLLQENRQSENAVSHVNGDFEIFLDQDSEQREQTLQIVMDGLKEFNHVNGSIRIYDLPRASERESETDYLERLRKTRETLASRLTAGTDNPQRTAEEWTFNALVIIAPSVEGVSSNPKAVTVKIDTQSQANWASLDTLERIGMDTCAEEMERPYFADGFGGESVVARRHVRLTWHEKGVARTRKTVFLVNENYGGFDLIVGRDFINDFMKTEGPTLLKKESVFHIKENHQTSAQLNAMEANVIEHNRQSESLANIRRRKEEEKKEEKKRQKAASRAASRLGTAIGSPAHIIASPVATSKRSSSSQFASNTAQNNEQTPAQDFISDDLTARSTSQVDQDT